MGCEKFGQRVNMASVTSTSARWDSAAGGQVEGAVRFAIPDGAVLALVSVTTGPVYLAVGPAAVYEADATTPKHLDGCLYPTNTAAGQGPHRVPCFRGGYLHVREAAAETRAKVEVSFEVE